MSGNPLGKFSNKLDEYSHIGWIPCIAGRLNYNNASSVKALGNKKAARGINTRIDPAKDGTGGSRIIAITSTHDWQDDERNILAYSPDNEEDERHDQPENQENKQYQQRSGDCLNGQFRIMALGRAEKFDDHCLFKIRVAIVSTKYKSAFDTAQQLFEKLLPKTNEGRDGKTRDEIFNELDASLNIFGTDLGNHAGHGYYLVEALLHPNGLILCKYNDSDQAAPASVGHKSTMVRQAYYYLKYIFHHHKHHREPDDCACTVIPIPQDHQAIGQKLVGNLTSSVNQFRRMLDSLGRCGVDHVGVIGYIGSLAKSCKRLGLYTDDAYEHQVERLTYVKESFSAMVTARSMNRITLFQAVTFALQATTLAILVLGTYCLLSGEPADNYVRVAAVFLLVVVSSILGWIFKIKRLKRYSAKLFALPRRQSLAFAAVLIVAAIGASVVFVNALRDFLGSSAEGSISVVQAGFKMEPVEATVRLLPEGDRAAAEPAEANLVLEPVNATLKLRVKVRPAESSADAVPAD